MIDRSYNDHYMNVLDRKRDFSYPQDKMFINPFVYW